MRNDPLIDLGMNGFDEIFMDSEDLKKNQLPKIFQIPLTEIDDFPDHPFKVKLDEDMDQLVESIKERGVITPITLRKKEDGRYEIVSGHRRKKACEIAGLETIPAEVKELTRDEAIILMVDSNLQRSTILPSEKAFSYKMRMEALKRQGKRNDLETSRPLGAKSREGRADEQIAENSVDSARQIVRYIRLTELIPELLDIVDEGKIAMRPAVELSYLKKDEQEYLLESMEFADATPSHAQAIKMRNFSREGRLSHDVIDSIMCEEKPSQKEKLHLSYSQARKFIPSSVPYEKTADYIYKALEFYQRHLERKKDAR